ncbi:NADPH:quinone reductase-like Zn-dependent oxidoreductase [Lentzea atacamensis]|uniref:NADPH:quinone reductase-like Zn-dependent oxidoreductase n=1 Tax=Lentzea atacamensis TaxID=531938 RepID=A0ABX9E0Z4_9PSEU|nr:NADP-dependent oxidoreductase [Lentzea atacamensis]RAS61830.1 NADPH:quinone reductase-like Zn-dependent oxidoreductase [Lentzea atacamensis]
MRAITQNEFGGPEVLTLTDLPKPAPLPTEVLVRVHAAGVNPVDWKTRAGGGMAGLQTMPLVLGWDVSGVVEEVGFGVTTLKPGDEVYGMPRFPHAASAYAEYVTAPSRHFAKKPESLTHVEAAALPLAALTAWQILKDTADVQPGQKVLITAAAGGVGHLAVQIAKARGAYVIGTAREPKHAFLKDLGADDVIDYTKGGYAGTDVDVLVDLVGGASPAPVRGGGLFVGVPSGVDSAIRDDIRTSPILVEPDRAGLEAIAALVESGELRVHVDATFPLEEAGKAHALGETGRTRGKIVLETL